MRTRLSPTSQAEAYRRGVIRKGLDMTDMKPATPWGLKWRRMAGTATADWHYSDGGPFITQDEATRWCQMLERECPMLIHTPHYFGDA